MHTVEVLEQAFAVAGSLGYQVRQEWLGGTGGGACEVGNRKLLFVDLALNHIEQLDQVMGALAADPAIHSLRLPPALQQQFRRAA